MQRTTMRAAAVVAPRRVEIDRVPVPDPGAGEVRIRVDGCGVCGSNLDPWRGLPWLRYPLGAGEAGHEAWGVVDAAGRDVRSLAVGDRVAVLSGRAWAEYDVAPAEHAVRLPPALDGRPFPGEAIACAVNVFRRSRIRAGDVVAVIGVGFLGALLVRLAAASGATVLAISRRPYALETAARSGAVRSIAWQEAGDVVEQVREATGGRLCERVIEVVGRQSALDLAGALVRERGTLVIAGYHQDGPRTVDLQQWNWRGIDVVNAHERDPAVYVEGMKLAIEATVRGEIDPLSLCTHEFPLERLGDALAMMEERPPGFLKAVVRP